jgi:DNA-binding transcriptional LysR family regulator
LAPIPLRNTTDRALWAFHTSVRRAYDAGVDRLARAPDLEELRTFCTAAELGTLGRAAARLHVTQPAISKRLRSHARRILVELADLTATLDELRGSTETVTLAISPTAADALLAAALLRVQREANMPVEVITANSRTVKQLVAHRQVAVGVAAFTLDEHPDGGELLFEDEIVVAAPLGHPWARARHVSPQELAATPIIRRDPGAHTRQIVDAAMHAAGFGPPIAAIEVGTTESAKQQAHERNLPAVMSRLAVTAADRLEVVRVDGVEFRRRFCAITPPGRSAGAERLVHALRAVAPA